MAFTLVGTFSRPADNGSQTGPTSGTLTFGTVGVQDGDLCIIVGQYRGSVTITVSETGGQTWNALTQYTTTNQTCRLFWCKWSTAAENGNNPTITNTSGALGLTAWIAVFRPTSSSYTIGVDNALASAAFAAPSSPFTMTITGVTPTKASTVALALWHTVDDNTYGAVSGTGWTAFADSQIRNPAGSDQSMGAAYKIQSSIAATGNPSKTQATLGGDAGIKAIITFYEESAGTNVTPGTGQLTLTGFAPTVSVSDNKNVSPGVGSLVLTGFAPTINISDHKNVTPGAGQLLITGFAPAFVQGVQVFPGVGSLVITGFAPTVNVTNHANVEPGAGQLTLTGFAPTINISDHKNVSPGSGQLIITGFAPTVIVTDHKEVFPGSGQLIITGFAPTVNISSNVFPGTGQLLLTGFAPTINIGTNVFPGAGQLVITGFAPTVIVTDHKTVFPGVGSLVITGFAPTINITDHKNVTPGVGQLVITGFAPVVSVTDHKNVTPGAGQLIITGFAPTVDIGSGEVNVSPGTGQMFITGFAPTVVISRGVLKYWDSQTQTWIPINIIVRLL